jgi:hypothetical protein
VDRKLIEEWDKKLSDLGLGMGAGFDHHIIKYGFTVSQLEDLHGRARDLPAEVHETQVRLGRQKRDRQRNAKRAQARAALRSAKAELRSKIWGSESAS